MKTVSGKTIRRRLLASVVTLMVSVSVLAQTRKAISTSLRLGDTVVVIPTPDGFEEAASQFDSVKTRFTATEDPGNDMLAVHMLTGDCEKLRHGEAGSLNFYTKISIRKAARETDFSALEFAAIPTEFRKNGATLLDINGPQMKASLDHIDKALSELSRSEEHTSELQS